MSHMRVLGIETSCDETAAAVVEDGKKLLSSVVASSVDLHTAYGGVVPEIAARSHLEVIKPVIEEAMKKAKTSWSEIDAIAVTQGPGLIGSLLIGVMTARTLAIAKQKPLYAVNHVHAHPYACFITETGSNFKLQTSNFRYELPKAAPEFPLLALIVSGGHTQLVLYESHKKYTMLGQTRDDAVGEAYDKVAKMLGLPYPGGPSIDKAAQKGNPQAFHFPKAKFDNVIGPTYHKEFGVVKNGCQSQSDYHFSFSGLKTAVLRLAQAQTGHDYTFPSAKLPEALSDAQKADIAASFQRTAVKTLVEALKKAEEEFQPKSVVIAGGVAANQELRKQAAKVLSTPLLVPDIKLCTDNAAMIASLAFYQQHRADPCSLQPDPGLKM